MFDWGLVQTLAVILSFLIFVGFVGWTLWDIFHETGPNKCCCFEFVGDNEKCTQHGHLYKHYKI